MAKAPPAASRSPRPRVPRSAILPRERLFVLLDRARERPVVWVSGPPGAARPRRGELSRSRQATASGTSSTKATPMSRRSSTTSASPRRTRGAGGRCRCSCRSTTRGLAVFTRRYFETLYARLKPPVRRGLRRLSRGRRFLGVPPGHARRARGACQPAAARCSISRGRPAGRDGAPAREQRRRRCSAGRTCASPARKPLRSRASGCRDCRDRSWTQIYAQDPGLGRRAGAPARAVEDVGRRSPMRRTCNRPAGIRLSRRARFSRRPTSARRTSC